jgi:hypothetical protein
MASAWKIGVLPPLVENVVELESGCAPGFDDAYAAASTALIAVIARRGRMEYRLVVDDLDMIVTPGLTEDGVVNLDRLGDALQRHGEYASAARH